MVTRKSEMEADYLCIVSDDKEPYILRKFIYEMAFSQIVIDSTELKMMDVFGARDVDEAYIKLGSILTKELSEVNKKIASYKGLKRKYYHVLFDAENWDAKEQELTSIHDEKVPIFMIWLQGYDNAPDVVRLCIERVRAILDDRFRLIVLDEQSIYDYLDIPKFIVKKREAGFIGNAHFCDICRVMLLNRYGGMYVDSDIYFTAESLPVYITQSKLFVYSIYADWRKYIEPRIASNWLIWEKGSTKILTAMEKLLLHYWHEETRIVDWLMFHQFFTMAAEAFPDEMDEVETIITWPSTVFREEINDVYDERRFRQICKIADAHILNHKSVYARISGEGRDTYSGHLLKENQIL